MTDGAAWPSEGSQSESAPMGRVPPGDAREARTFRLAHDRYDPGLAKFFTARGVAPAAAEDLCQETWVALWKTTVDGRYDPKRSALSTFLYAIAMNVWLRHRRQAATDRRRADEIESLAERAGAGEQNPGGAAAFAELLEAVIRSVSGRESDHSGTTLTDEDRSILVALARGASDRDLAAILNVAPSTAHARKAAALSRLRRVLAEQGFRAGETDHSG